MALTEQEVKRSIILPARFIGRHCRIQDGDGGPAIPFKLWPFQLDVIDDIQDQARMIVLKARQLGLSWLTLAYILWLCSCNDGQTALILNRGLRESVELLERIKFMHKRLPPELQQRIVKESGEQLHFANGSRIYSLTAGEYTGSGLTAQFVMLDEWSKIRGIRKILVSLLPTLAAGGTLVGIATAVGFHNAFAEEWRKAISGSSSYYPIFIPWDAHPARDDAWYEQKRLEMPTERDLHQEYPAEWLDAFQLPGESVFRDEFDRAEHVIQEMPDPDAKWPDVRGIDFGYHHGIVLWAEVQANRNVFVYAELHAERTTTRTMMQEAVAMDAELGVDTTATAAGCDPAGKAQTSVATESDHFTVQSFGIRVMSAEVAPKDRVQQIKQLLKEGRLQIHESCGFLIEALEQAQWAKTGAPQHSQSTDPILKETYEKDGFYEHPLDTLGYLLINVFPVYGAPAGASGKDARGGKRTGKRRAGYSESEYG
jgi:Terminase RNaseH-like domain